MFSIAAVKNNFLLFRLWKPTALRGIRNKTSICAADRRHPDRTPAKQDPNEELCPDLARDRPLTLFGHHPSATHGELGRRLND